LKLNIFSLIGSFVATPTIYLLSVSCNHVSNPSSFQFVTVTEGKLFCDNASFKDNAEGLQLCFQHCSKRTKDCTAIEGWGRITYFLYAGIVTLDAAHNLVSAFGDGVIPFCTRRYYETSCPTYSLKIVAWAAVVAFTGLSLITYREVTAVTQLVWIIGASGAYLLVSMIIMVAESRLRRGAAHMRAAEAVELELLRQHHSSRIPTSPSHDKNLKRQLSLEKPSSRSSSAFVARSSKGGSRHGSDKVHYASIDHGRKLDGYQQRLREAELESETMRTKFGIEAAATFDADNDSLNSEVARVRIVSAQVADERRQREEGGNSYGQSTNPDWQQFNSMQLGDRQSKHMPDGYLQLGMGGR
jgi:hypothetical protein